MTLSSVKFATGTKSELPLKLVASSSEVSLIARQMGHQVPIANVFLWSTKLRDSNALKSIEENRMESHCSTAATARRLNSNFKRNRLFYFNDINACLKCSTRSQMRSDYVRRRRRLVCLGLIARQIKPLTLL